MGVVKKIRSHLQGFTLIELLIVIGIIAVLAAATFVALNPLTRFQDARDARRRTDISAVLSAAKVSQVDLKGYYPEAIKNAAASPTIHMLGTCDGTTANEVATDATITAACDTDPTVVACLDIGSGTEGLVTDGYLGAVPQSPAGTLTWGLAADETVDMSGYTLEKSSTGILTIRACESENTTEISASR